MVNHITFDCKAHDFIDRNYENIIIDIKTVASVPSPSFMEERRIRFLKKYVQDIGYNSSKIDKIGNLRVNLNGKKQETLIFSAHADTVFPEGTELKIKEDKKTISCPGICDNSTGTVALLYLLRYIKENNIKPLYNTIFIFNVGEEAPGNLRGIRHFFSSVKKDKIRAHICVEGHMLGRLTLKFTGSERRSITVHGEGGHSFRDFGNTNAIVAAADLIHRLSLIRLPKTPKTTLNIGTITGGTSVNSIPEQAEFTLEIRSSKKANLEAVRRKVDRIMTYAKKQGYVIESNIIDERPCAKTEDTTLKKTIRKIHKHLQINTIDDIGSTDSNYPSSIGIPSVTIGMTEACNTHSKDEYLEKAPVKKGVEQLIMIFEELQEG